MAKVSVMEAKLWRAAFSIKSAHRSTEARILEERLRQKIVGQDEAVQAVIDLYKYFVPASTRQAPLGICFF